MSEVFGVINGWQIRDRRDGSYGVYDDHGMVSGPHGSKTEAIGAALQLPKSLPLSVFLRSRLREPAEGTPLEQD